MLDTATLRNDLERHKHEPWIVAEMIKATSEVDAAGLANLAWLLASCAYGCSYNDVLWLIEALEKYQLKENNNHE